HRKFLALFQSFRDTEASRDLVYENLRQSEGMENVRLWCRRPVDDWRTLQRLDILYLYQARTMLRGLGKDGFPERAKKALKDAQWDGEQRKWVRWIDHCGMGRGNV